MCSKTGRNINRAQLPQSFNGPALSLLWVSTDIPSDPESLSTQGGLNGTWTKVRGTPEDLLPSEVPQILIPHDSNVEGVCGDLLVNEHTQCTMCEALGLLFYFS